MVEYGVPDCCGEEEGRNVPLREVLTESLSPGCRVCGY